jgi:hypothetical protein
LKRLLTMMELPKGQVDVLLQVVIGGSGVSSAKFLLILLMVGEHLWREHLAFLPAQAEHKGIKSKPIKYEFPKGQNVLGFGESRSFRGQVLQ